MHRLCILDSSENKWLVKNTVHGVLVVVTVQRIRRAFGERAAATLVCGRGTVFTECRLPQREAGTLLAVVDRAASLGHDPPRFTEFKYRSLHQSADSSRVADQPPSRSN